MVIDPCGFQAVVELRWGPRGSGPPERPGGPRETSVLRGFKGACKRPSEIARWSPIIYRCFIAISICKCFFLYWNCSRKTFWSPEMWLLEGSWGWSLALQSKSLALASRVVLGLECLVWLHLTQSAIDKNSLLHWFDGVCWRWQYVPAHRNDITYLLTISAVFLHLHLILSNLLLLVT